MAGRRRDYSGLAAGLGVLGRAIETGINEDLQSRRDWREFQQRLILAGLGVARTQATQYARGVQQDVSLLSKEKPGTPLTSIPRTDVGQAMIQQDLEAGKTESPAALLTRGIPKAGASTDPLQRALRIAALQSKLQQIKQRNQLAPLLASEAYQKNYPSPTMGFGGYVNTKPNWFQSMLGEQQRPTAPVIQPTDTTFLEQQLQQAMGGAMPQPTTVPMDRIAQRIQQLRSQGVSDQTIATHLREKGIDPSQYGL